MEVDSNDESIASNYESSPTNSDSDSEAVPYFDIFDVDSKDSDAERRDITVLDSDTLDEHSESPMRDSEWMITGKHTSNHNRLDGELIQDIGASNDIRSVDDIHDATEKVG